MKYYFICKCSNCGKFKGVKETKVKENHKCISHGICASCIAELYKDDFSEEELQALIDNANNK
jgi:hypothetical protein